MAFELLEHEADVGVLGIGKTLEEAFQEGAKAMFSVMVNLDDLSPDKMVQVECDAVDDESLFVEWLNALLAQKDIEELFFVKFEVKIEDHKLVGKAWGCSFDLDKQEVLNDVKAATYHGLRLEKKDKDYYIRCVLDI